MDAHADPHTRPGKVLAMAVVMTVLALAITALTVTGATPKTQLVSKTGSGDQIGSVSDGFGVNDSGHLVVFVTDQNDNGNGDGNFERDVYLRKVKDGSTKIVSVSSGKKIGDDDSWDPAISGQGRFVAFASSARNFSGLSNGFAQVYLLSLIHISEPTRHICLSRMPSSA